jgi:hypothetical protein
VRERKSNFGEAFDSSSGWQNLFTSMTFSSSNEHTLSLQGQLCNIFVMNDKIKTFERKLLIWSKRIDIGIYMMFSQYCHIVTDKHIVT